jgi:hypothetical protein
VNHRTALAERAAAAPASVAASAFGPLPVSMDASADEAASLVAASGAGVPTKVSSSHAIEIATTTAK